MKASSYLKSTSTPGETLLFSTQAHPLAVVPHIVIGLVAAYLCAQGVRAFQVAETVPWAWAILAVPGFYLADRITAYLTTSATITTTRMVGESGLLMRVVTDIASEKIESVSIRQGVIGRMCGFGDLVVRGSGGNESVIAALDNIMEFRAAIQSALQQAAGR